MVPCKWVRGFIFGCVFLRFVRCATFFQDFEFFPWGNAYFVTEECKGAGEYVPWSMNDENWNDENWKVAAMEIPRFFSFSGKGWWHAALFPLKAGRRQYSSEKSWEWGTGCEFSEANVRFPTVFCWCLFQRVTKKRGFFDAFDWCDEKWNGLNTVLACLVGYGRLIHHKGFQPDMYQIYPLGLFGT